LCEAHGACLASCDRDAHCVELLDQQCEDVFSLIIFLVFVTEMVSIIRIVSSLPLCDHEREDACGGRQSVLLRRCSELYHST
jgi:hypothetical protein